MIQQLSIADIIALFQKDPHKYTYALNILSNIGNPDLALTGATGFSIGNDVLVAYEYRSVDVEVYMDIEDASHLYEFHTAIEPVIRRFDEVMFSSPTDAIFHSPAFIELYGEHELIYSEQYGMFQKRTDAIPLNDGAVIRRLTVNDEAPVMAFDEPFVPYRLNLRNAFESCIRKNHAGYAVYVYIDGHEHEKIMGYLVADTFDGSYWDIAYIYVSESARGNGIAKSLARFYAKATQDSGGFASYGTPENEISKKVAIACGFERFEVRYQTKWQAVSR